MQKLICCWHIFCHHQRTLLPLCRFLSVFLWFMVFFLPLWPWALPQSRHSTVIVPAINSNIEHRKSLVKNGCGLQKSIASFELVENEMEKPQWKKSCLVCEHLYEQQWHRRQSRKATRSMQKRKRERKEFKPGFEWLVWCLENTAYLLGFLPEFTESMKLYPLPHHVLLYGQKVHF